jgi:hypothetical protein
MSTKCCVVWCSFSALSVNERLAAFQEDGRAVLVLMPTARYVLPSEGRTQRQLVVVLTRSRAKDRLAVFRRLALRASHRESVPMLGLSKYGVRTERELLANYGWELPPPTTSSHPHHSFLHRTNTTYGSTTSLNRQHHHLIYVVSIKSTECLLAHHHF